VLVPRCPNRVYFVRMFCRWFILGRICCVRESERERRTHTANPWGVI
jgi:hypothetical protein